MINKIKKFFKDFGLSEIRVRDENYWKTVNQ